MNSYFLQSFDVKRSMECTRSFSSLALLSKQFQAAANSLYPTQSVNPVPSGSIPPLEFGRAVPSIIEPWRAFSMTFHWFDGTCRGSSSCPSAVPCCCTYGWVTLRRKKQMQKHFLERNNTCHVKNIEKLDCERQKTNIILTLPSSDDAVESARSSLISAFVKCNPREVVTCRNNGGIYAFSQHSSCGFAPTISCLTHPSRISQLVRIDTDRLSCRLEQSAICATSRLWRC